MDREKLEENTVMDEKKPEANYSMQRKKTEDNSVMNGRTLTKTMLWKEES